MSDNTVQKYDMNSAALTADDLWKIRRVIALKYYAAHSLYMLQAVIMLEQISFLKDTRESPNISSLSNDGTSGRFVKSAHKVELCDDPSIIIEKLVEANAPNSVNCRSVVAIDLDAFIRPKRRSMSASSLVKYEADDFEDTGSIEISSDTT